MKTYDSIESLYRDLEKEVKTELRVIARKIKADIDKYIDDNIYNAYEPFIYERTKELGKSCKVTPVQNIGGEWYIEVYIKEEVHKNPSNWRGEQRTFDEIIEFFENGEATWRNGKVETISLAEKKWVTMGKALREIQNFLKSKYNIIK